MTVFEVEPTFEMVQRAEELLKDYSWKKQEIERLTVVLGNAGERIVGSYEPNAKIQAQYKNSDKTQSEVLNRDKKWQRLKKFREDVAQLECCIRFIEETRKIAFGMFLDPTES